MSEQTEAYTLTYIFRRITNALVADSDLNGAWIVGETIDVRKSGHCYLELVEKDAAGKIVARARATIWQGTYYKIAQQFKRETGMNFDSNLQVMVYANVSCHPVYGLSLNILAINPVYTLGDAMKRRQEMIAKLQTEGIINLNKEKPWPKYPKRVAIISASGAAGFGDFMDHLVNNKVGLKFEVALFSSLMQGESAAKNIVERLYDIQEEEGAWDCVVIIRGGGATAELLCFDDYELAKTIAECKIPVVIGIGHERDITLLDYVANMRVKTPTAAADWLIHMGQVALDELHSIAQSIHQVAMSRISGCNQQLAYIDGNLPALAMAALNRAQRKLDSAQTALRSTADQKLRPQMSRLDAIALAIPQMANFLTDKAKQRLDSIDQLLKAISPEATLRRGYTITRVNGHAASSAVQITPGSEIETVFADGSITSIVEKAQ